MGTTRTRTRWALGAGAAAAAAGTGVAVAARRATPRPREDRWHKVTVGVPLRDLPDAARLPGPLAELLPDVEIRLEEAPGGRGTELSARPDGSSAFARTAWDPRAVVRSALRDTKALLECGEVLRVRPRPEGRRPRTPGGLFVDAAERRAAGRGIL